METITSESARNANLSNNIDKLRSRVQEKSDDLSIIFPAFEVRAFEHNLFRLLAESTKEVFKIGWTYRPDYVSMEFYGTTIYYTLILFVNEVDSIENFFSFDYILVPPFGSILEIAGYRGLVDELDVLTEEPPSENKYYKRSAYEDIINKKKAEDNVERESEWIESNVDTDDDMGEVYDAGDW